MNLAGVPPALQIASLRVLAGIPCSLRLAWSAEFRTRLILDEQARSPCRLLHLARGIGIQGTAKPLKRGRILSLSCLCQSAARLEINPSFCLNYTIYGARPGRCPDLVPSAFVVLTGLEDVVSASRRPCSRGRRRSSPRTYWPGNEYRGSEQYAASKTTFSYRS